MRSTLRPQHLPALRAPSMARPAGWLPVLALLVAGCPPKDAEPGETDDSGVVDTTVDTVDTGDDTGGVDTGDTGTDTAETAETAETDDTGTATPGPNDLVVGDIVITEIMVNPTACLDPRGEYIEFLYQGTVTVDLGGLIIENGGGSAEPVAGPLLVNPGERVVIYAEGARPNPCYTFPTPSSTYSSALSLPQAGDRISLKDGTGRTLDEVDYALFPPAPEGASWELGDGITPDVSTNGDRDNWCRAEVQIAGSVDRGTPGTANTCTPPALDTGDTSDTGEPTPRLMITEVLDFSAPDTLRFVEIFNPEPDPVSLADWSLAIYLDGSAAPVTSQFPPSATVPAGGFYVVGPNNGSPDADYVFAFGRRPDSRLGAVQGNGDDAYELLLQGTRVDVFGVPGEDGTGQVWDYTDKVAWRLASVNQPRGSFLRDEWSIDPLSRENAWQREPDLDTGDTNSNDSTIVDTFNETEIRGETTETAIEETGTRPLELADLAPGDLLIVEIMSAPAQCTGSNGEYVAILVNPALGAPVELSGLRIDTNQGLPFVFSGSRLVTPGTEVVLWRRPTSGAQCYGWVQGFGIDYTTITLGDVTDSVRISDSSGATPFDEVAYGPSFGAGAGASIQLDPRREDPTDNNDATSWCASETPFALAAFPFLSADLGSPGSANSTCDLGGDTGDTDVPVLLVADLDPGDLVITEVMGDPIAPCADENGEYVELRNTTNARVRLDGLGLRIASASSTLSTSVELAPGEFAILARTPTAAPCYTFPSVPTIAYGNSLDMPNGTGADVSLRVGTSVIDAVNFAAFSPSKFVEGISWSLDRDAVDATLNDAQSNWCNVGSAIGGGNTGTPGAVFDCP